MTKIWALFILIHKKCNDFDCLSCKGGNNDQLRDMHPGLTIYKLFFNPDSDVILMCDYVEEERIQYFQLESRQEFDFVMNDFS